MNEIEWRRAVVMDCTAMKQGEDEPLLPAIRRYWHGKIQVALRWIREGPPEEVKRTDFLFLSAKYGLIPAGTPIPMYEYKMSLQRAKEINKDTVKKLVTLAKTRHYFEIFLSVSTLYRQALRGLLEELPSYTRLLTSTASTHQSLATMREYLWHDYDYMLPGNGGLIAFDA